MLIRGFKTEIDPNNQQITLLRKNAGAARMAWNWGLDQKKQALQNKEHLPSAIDLHRRFFRTAKYFINNNMNDPELSPRQKLLDEVVLMMGGGMVDVELDPTHLNLAFERALKTYRQRSGNALEESFVFLDIQPEVTRYRLPDEIQEVRTIYRRTIGGTAGGASIDPFSLAFTNNIYMIQNPGALGTTGSGILATFDFAMQYQKLVGTMFGMFVVFTYDSSTHILVLERKFTAVETVQLHVYNTRPENVILGDPYANPWLTDYTLANCKMWLGEARSKFGSFVGPSGSFNLNGEAMKAEAKEMKEKLEQELKDYLDQHIGGAFFIG